MESKVLAQRIEGGCTLQAVLGDMTCERVDAIVNAANSNLAHLGGLAGAIVDRGGLIIQEESSQLAPVAVGKAVVTSAGDLPCRWVIHAVGPIWGSGDEEAALRSAVRSSLDHANALGAASVALPAISTGIFGYPKQEGVHCIIDEATHWLRTHPATSVTTLRFTAFDNSTADLFAAEVRVDQSQT